MKNLSFEEIRALTHGAARVTEESDGLHFHKCTERQERTWKELNEFVYQNTFSTAGIRIEFETDAQKLAFNAPSGNKYEICVNGIFHCQFLLNNLRERNEKPVADLGDGVKRVMLALPSHGSRAVISSLSLEGETFVRPVVYSRRILFLGDSITQGWDSTYDTLSFAYRTAMNLDADFFINANGGAFYAPAAFDVLPFDPDTVIIAFGTNDFGNPNHPVERNIANANAYLDLVKKAYGDRRVVVLTPIWRNDKSEEWHKVARSSIEQSARERGFETIDGAKLLPKSTAFFADGFLHPNDLGFSIYADRLTKYLVEGSL